MEPMEDQLSPDQVSQMPHDLLQSLEDLVQPWEDQLFPDQGFLVLAVSRMKSVGVNQ